MQSIVVSGAEWTFLVASLARPFVEIYTYHPPLAEASTTTNPTPPLRPSAHEAVIG